MPRRLALALFWGVLLTAATLADERPLRLLFLGDNGHHRPADRFAQLEPVLARRGIKLVYTDKVESLEAKALAPYDGLVIYANTTAISPEQEQALVAYVAGGKGLVALHCASYCFLNSPKYIELVGGQFSRHGTGIVRTSIVATDHPLVRGFDGFESWDETYVHTKHNADRTVLETHPGAGADEPWTWVRTHGKGRVFYTAWGHDERTWSHAGFQNLVERGIRWATGGDPSAAGAYHDPARFPLPKMTPRRGDVEPFTYVDVGKKIPNYTPGKKWGAQGEPRNLMQSPLPPAESMKHLVVPEGFHVELFAAEPELGGKPIAMAWDERGRLWVAETYDYPNELQPAGEGRDRIRICEDTDGDGRADKFTVFAEKLSIPTSICFSRGGAIVFDATQTVFLKDTDGDDVADERRVLFGTWAKGDTHGGPSNMQYGLDNWIWAMQGYNRSKLEVGGETHEFRQGFLRFKPDGSKLEFLRSTDNNTWGLGISEDGYAFGSTANHNPSVQMTIPNRYYEAVRGWKPSLVLPSIADSHLFRPITDKVRQVDHFGGYTAAAGHALYTARRYPREYWNRVALVCEPTGHLVGAFVIDRQGSGFASSNPFNLLASDDEWTAPVMAEVGPDGNVWVIDWYNYIVQHNPTPVGFKTGKGAAYESDLRDKKHGRIYRVVYDGGAKVDGQRVSLAGASPERLVETLKNPNLLWRRHAQRLLVERGQRDVAAALVKLARDRSVDEIGLNVGAIHALWTLDGLGLLDGSNADVSAVVAEALAHPSAGVRRNAVQVLPKSSESVDLILKARLVDDPDAGGRLAALLALCDQPPAAQAADVALAVLRDAKSVAERPFAAAATCLAAHNADRFLEQLTKNAEPPSAKLIEVAGIVAGHRARTGPFESAESLIAPLAGCDARLTDAIVQGLAGGWPKDHAPRLTPALEEAIGRLAPRLSITATGSLVRLASQWGSHQLEERAAAISGELAARAGDETLGDGERIEAAGELVSFRSLDPAAAGMVLEMVTPRVPTDLAVGLLRAVEKSEADETGALVVARLATLTPSVRTTGIGVLLSRPRWTEELLNQAEAGKADLGGLSLDQQQALSEHPDKALRSRAQDLLKKKGALPNEDRRKVLDELLPVARITGDAAAGKLVYVKQCSKCHVHGSLGQRVGPDLTRMAVHTKEELLGNILDPSRSVEGNFRVYTVTTTAGQVLTGLLASESKTAVELFDAEGREIAIGRDEIDELVASQKSLMPEGFEKQVTRQELVDLLEFLAQRSGFKPLPLEEAATIVTTRGMFYSKDSEAERLVFGDWGPKEFQGVPFQLVDPQGDRQPNAILLHGPKGPVSAMMPKTASVRCGTAARLIHLLGGVSGWGFPAGAKDSVSMIVRLHYADGQQEDHELKNGEHLADYIRRVDVPGSQFAFDLEGRQLRYLAITPARAEVIERIELAKAPDDTSPIVMAITVETAN